MRATLDFDLRSFNRGLVGLAKALAAKQGLDASTARGRALNESARIVLEQCVKLTPARKARTIREDVARQAQWRKVSDGTNDLTINNGARGGTKGQHWLWVPDRSKRARGRAAHRTTDSGGRGGGMFLRMPNRRIKGDNQAAYRSLLGKLAAAKADLKKAQAKAVGARGLAQASWVQIADRANIKLRNIASYIRAAVPRNGRRYQNGVATRGAQNGTSFLEIVNTYPYLLHGSVTRKKRRMDGRAILQRALNARGRGFATDMKKGVFDDIETAVQRYPGLFTE